MSQFKPDLDQYEYDFEDLQPYEKNAMASLEAVSSMSRWAPSDYERYYLPKLRLAGIRNKRDIILQSCADLHIHTRWSDGDEIERVLAKALELGLDAIAITDHDEIGGAFVARRIVHEQRLPIAVIPGIEVSSAEGHIGALFVMQPIPSGMSALETVQAIHDAGGLAVAHHPFTPQWLDTLLNVRLSCRDLVKIVPFDAIECINAVPGSGKRYNMTAIETMHKEHINIAVTGGSDAHLAQFVGKGRTYYAGNEGVLSLRQALIHGFTMGSEDYWTFQEKIQYYMRLGKSVVRNTLHKFGSVN
ncbi:MAG: PHP domain-containing protein [Calditrichia bacterium]